MNLLYMAGIGIVAGMIAKAITPQKETGGWISSLIVGILGGILGGMLPLVGILGDSLLALVGKATIGSVIILWVYHKYLADKWNIKV